MVWRGAGPRVALGRRRPQHRRDGSVYRQQIHPALRSGAVAMDRIFEAGREPQ